LAVLSKLVDAGARANCLLLVEMLQVTLLCALLLPPLL
jgi:hypothetical protein